MLVLTMGLSVIVPTPVTVLIRNLVLSDTLVITHCIYLQKPTNVQTQGVTGMNKGHPLSVSHGQLVYSIHNGTDNC